MIILLETAACLAQLTRNQKKTPFQTEKPTYTCRNHPNSVRLSPNSSFSVIGNDVLHSLTRKRNIELKIQLWDFDSTAKFAFYDRFFVANESNKYRLTLGVYSGNAGKYQKRLLLRWIHHFKSDLINNMDNMRISDTEPSLVIRNKTKKFF